MTGIAAGVMPRIPVRPWLVRQVRPLEIAVRGLSRAHFAHDDPLVLEVELQEDAKGADFERVDRLVAGRRPELLDMEPRYLLCFKNLQPGGDAAAVLGLEPLQILQRTGDVLERERHSSPSSASTCSWV